MADRNDIRFQAGQAVGQGQVKKDDMMDKAAQSAKETKEQAGGFLQQTGEQVKNMAQGAADAVKNAVGIADNKDANTGLATTTGPATTTTTTRPASSKH